MESHSRLHTLTDYRLPSFDQAVYVVYIALAELLICQFLDLSLFISTLTAVAAWSLPSQRAHSMNRLQEGDYFQDSICSMNLLICDMLSKVRPLALRI